MQYFSISAEVYTEWAKNSGTKPTLFCFVILKHVLDQVDDYIQS